MSKKSKGILKFLIACGVVISAVAAVFAIVCRMHSKLKEEEELLDEGDEDESCDGECEGCTICADDTAEEAEESVEKTEETKE